MISKEEKIKEMKKRMTTELKQTQYQQSDVCMISIFDIRDSLEHIEELESENHSLKVISRAEIEQREILEEREQKLIDKLEEKQKEIDDLNQFYETYEINYEGQAVLIDRNRFKEVIGADKEFSILVVNALPSIEEN